MSPFLRDSRLSLLPTLPTMTEFHIVEITPTKCEQLAVYPTHEEAFQNACHFIDVYDQGRIDILSTDELIAMQHIIE